MTKQERRIAWIIFENMEGVRGDYSVFCAQLDFVDANPRQRALASPIERSLFAARDIINEYELD